MENVLHEKIKVNPDKLSDLFIQLTNDLAYSTTFYPKSITTQYLNQLLTSVHNRLYKNKKERAATFLHFWKIGLPLIVYKRRMTLLYAFLIFGFSVMIGAFSAANDVNFVRVILGDSYVNQTLENIENGTPMAIYESKGQADMFLGITFNNIRVSFYVFALGLCFSFGTGLLLFYNGIMLGCFQYFFFQQGYLIDSVLSIWVHGTLEITAIIVAGGAGLILGNSFMFPDSYSRKESFRQGVKDSVKIIIGLVPIFIMAGFLEGFVTRHADILPAMSVLIIACSMLFVVFYFIIYPIYLTTKFTQNGDH